MTRFKTTKTHTSTVLAFYHDSGEHFSIAINDGELDDMSIDEAKARIAEKLGGDVCDCPTYEVGPAGFYNKHNCPYCR